MCRPVNCSSGRGWPLNSPTGFDHAEAATRADFHRFHDGFRNTEKTALFLTMISERIAALLDGDRGQP